MGERIKTFNEKLQAIARMAEPYQTRAYAKVIEGLRVAGMNYRETAQAFKRAGIDADAYEDICLRVDDYLAHPLPPDAVPAPGQTYKW